MIEQTFTEKVPDVIEVLSQAATFASSKLNESVYVRLGITTLGLEIVVTRATYVPSNRKVRNIISWIELAHAKDNGLEIIKYRIESCVDSVNRAAETRDDC